MALAKLPNALFALLSPIAYHTVFNFTAQHGLSKIQDLIQAGKVGDGNPLRQVYTGIPAIDEMARLLVVSFYTPTRDLPSQLITGELLGLFVTLIGLMLIESARPRSSIFARYPTIWCLIAQLFTGAATVPVYFAMNYTPNMPTTPISFNYAIAVFLGCLFGGVAPTALMLNPDLLTVDQHQIVIAAWQLMPLWVSLFTSFFALVLPKTPPKGWSGKDATRTVYALFTLGGFFVHQWALMIILLDPKATFKDVFIPTTLAIPTYENGIKLLFQFDFIFISIAALFWTSLIIARDPDSGGLVKTALVLMGLAAVISPQAAISAAFWWREGMERRQANKAKKAQ